MIERLQIYKDAYELTTRIYKAMPQIEKMHRFTIGSRLLDCSLDMFKWITMANKSREKTDRLKYLDEFLTNFEMLRVYLRICLDLKLLKVNALTDIFILIENISRQLTGWRFATTRA